MAEIYFSQKKYPKSRKHYFNLINLSPDADNEHLALNKIGDTYILENKHRAALSVFDQSWKRPAAFEGSADLSADCPAELTPRTVPSS